MSLHNITGPDWTTRNPFAPLVSAFPRFRVRDWGLVVLQAAIGAMFFFVISFTAIGILIAERGS